MSLRPWTVQERQHERRRLNSFPTSKKFTCVKFLLSVEVNNFFEYKVRASKNCLILSSLVCENKRPPPPLDTHSPHIYARTHTYTHTLAGVLKSPEVKKKRVNSSSPQFITRSTTKLQLGPWVVNLQRNWLFDLTQCFSKECVHN